MGPCPSARRAASAIAVCVLLLAFSPAGRAQELHDLLAGEQFGKLDEIADELWRTQRKDDEGEWVLQYFYDEISRPAGEETEQSWQTHLGRLERWVARAPESATARAVHGDALVGYAWLARGSGYARTVTQEGWQNFEARLRQAKAVLEAGLRLRHRVPGLYTSLLTIAMGQGWGDESYDLVFSAAIAFEPTYYPFYYRKAYRLQPRWQGSPGAWQAFALESAESLRATHGLALYAMIVKSVIGMIGTRDLFRFKWLSWTRLDESLRDLRRLTPKSEFNRSLHAWCAWVMQDRAAAQEVGIPPARAYVSDLWASAEETRAFEAWVRRADGDDDVRARLDALPFSLRLDRSPLVTVLERIAEIAELTLVVDETLRSDAAGDPYLRPVDCGYEDVTVGFALDELVRAHGLACGLRGGALYVTTPARLGAIPAEGGWASAGDRPVAEKLGKAQAVRGRFAVSKVAEIVTEATGVALRLEGVEPGREIQVCFAARPLADLLPILAFQLNAVPEIAGDAVLLRARTDAGPAGGATPDEAVSPRAWLRTIQRGNVVTVGKFRGRGKDYLLGASLFSRGLHGLHRALQSLSPEQRSAAVGSTETRDLLVSGYYNFACTLAVCSTGRRSPNHPAEPVAAERAEAMRTRAFEALGHALSLGQKLESLILDPDLECLHDDPRWQQLLPGCK